jgi:hypothetical protein
LKENSSLSLYPKKPSTIASGATTIGSAGRAPDDTIEQNKQLHEGFKEKSLLEPILETFSTIASGATPIGRYGHTPNEISVSKNNKEGERKLVY